MKISENNMSNASTQEVKSTCSAKKSIIAALALATIGLLAFRSRNQYTLLAQKAEKSTDDTMMRLPESDREEIQGAMLRWQHAPSTSRKLFPSKEHAVLTDLCVEAFKELCTDGFSSSHAKFNPVQVRLEHSSECHIKDLSHPPAYTFWDSKEPLESCVELAEETVDDLKADGIDLAKSPFIDGGNKACFTMIKERRHLKG